jgi:hypothetical protein
MRKIFPRLATVAGLLVICLGTTSTRSCTFFGSNGNSGSNGSLSFVTELRLQRPGGDITDSFERGESIEMVLTVRNRLNRSVDVDFTDSRTSDFVVVRENSEDVVWQASDAATVTTTPAPTLTFQAGETKTFNITWSQLSSSGSQVRADSYEARGVLVFSGFDSDPLRSNQMGSSPQRFTIH